MSAPAGWHLQPDGQERYWDGTAVDRPVPGPAAQRPHRPAAAALVGRRRSTRPRRSTSTGTQAIPAPAAPEQPAQPGYHASRRHDPASAQQDYAPARASAGHRPRATRSPATSRPATRRPATAPPPASRYAPPPRQGSGLAKGCLIAALIGVLVARCRHRRGDLRLQPRRRHDQRDLPLGPAHRPADRLPDRPAHRGPRRADRAHRRRRLRAAPRDHRSRAGRWRPQGAGIPVVNDQSG